MVLALGQSQADPIARVRERQSTFAIVTGREIACRAVILDSTAPFRAQHAMLTGTARASLVALHVTPFGLLVPLHGLAVVKPHDALPHADPCLATLRLWVQ